MKTQFSTEFDKKVNEAVDYINTKVTDIPRVAVVLGSGLAYFGDKIEADQVVETSGIPHFPEPTVSGHQGKMIFGRVGDAKLIALKGRSHYYEGKPLEAVTFYVHLLKKLGVEILVLTNAAGGVNPNYTPGDFVLITGFMNFGQVAVYGETDDTNLLSAELQAKALAVSRKNNVDLARGVYCWTTGPSF